MNPMEAFGDALFNSRLQAAQARIDGKPEKSNVQWFQELAKAASDKAPTLREALTFVAPGLVKATDTASQVSRREFPDQNWDNSQRNALRHSMWIGGMAKAMGAGPDSPYLSIPAQALAKGIGYANEGATYLMNLSGYGGAPASDVTYRRDTLHDLNNNAVGAAVAGMARTPEEMRAILTNMAYQAKGGRPVGKFEASNGKLSYDPNTRERVLQDPTLAMQ